MNEFYFDGRHLALCLGLLVLGFALGALWGWLMRDE